MKFLRGDELKAARPYKSEITINRQFIIIVKVLDKITNYEYLFETLYYLIFIFILVFHT